MGNITNYTINNKCSNCGQCCTDFAIISKKEAEVIRRFIAKNNIKEQNNEVIDGMVPMICPFRDNEDRKCLIYPVRPEICRRFKCNLGDAAIEKIKNVSDKYYNTTISNIISWHFLFYKNRLQQDKYDIDTVNIRSIIRRKL